METFFLNLGCSFTLSKILAYFTFVLFGILFALFFNSKSKKSQIAKLPRLLISLVLIVLPFSIYFALNPIYEGDFSNNSYEVKSNINFPKNKQLTVVALANCPYCIESTQTIKRIKKYFPSLTIEYWILSSNPAHQMKYKKLLKKAAIVKLKPIDAKELATISRGSFPTFVLSNNKKTIKAWNNDSFGVRAWDEVGNFSIENE